MGDSSDLPMVECTVCGRTVQCVRVKDGTVYRPFAWKFTDPEHPLRGVCGSHFTVEIR